MANSRSLLSSFSRHGGMGRIRRPFGSLAVAAAVALLVATAALVSARHHRHRHGSRASSPRYVTVSLHGEGTAASKGSVVVTLPPPPQGNHLGGQPRNQKHDSDAKKSLLAPNENAAALSLQHRRLGERGAVVPGEAAAHKDAAVAAASSGHHSSLGGHPSLLPHIAVADEVALQQAKLRVCARAGDARACFLPGLPASAAEAGGHSFEKSEAALIDWVPSASVLRAAVALGSLEIDVEAVARVGSSDGAPQPTAPTSVRLVVTFGRGRSDDLSLQTHMADALRMQREDADEEQHRRLAVAAAASATATTTATVPSSGSRSRRRTAAVSHLAPTKLAGRPALVSSLLQNSPTYNSIAAGASSDGTVTQDEAAYFRFLFHDNDAVVTVSGMTRWGGGIELYVVFCSDRDACNDASAIPSPSNRDISGLEEEPYVTFSTSSFAPRAKCQHGRVCIANIAVVASPESEADWSTFTLTVDSHANSTVLTSGWPIIDELVVPPVPAEKFFKVEVPTVALMRIILTPLSGDPDLYISYDAANKTPGPGHNDGASNSLGVEILDMHGHKCGTGTASCHFYIGVREFTDRNASFTLLATTQGTGSVNLTESVPQDGEVSKGHHVYYYFQVPATNKAEDRSVTITVTPRGSSDPDLFVNFDGYFPSRTNASASATHASGAVDQIHLTPRDARWPSDCSNTAHECVITIAVYGWTNSNYSILAEVNGGSGGENVPLRAGLPVHSIADNKRGDLYVFKPTGSDRQTIEFVVTTITGDPDLFLSTKTMTPSLHNYTWSSFSTHNETVFIFPTDERYHWSDPIYISVVAFYGTASYSIVAMQGQANQSVTLVPGLPQFGLVHTGAAQYFTYKTSPSFKPSHDFASLNFTVNLFEGNTRLYLSRAAAGRPPVYPQVECLQSFFGVCLQWDIPSDQYDTAGALTDSGTLVASYGGNDLAPNTYYTATVFGAGATGDDSSFTVVLDALNGSSQIIDLTWFELRSASVAAHDYAYFHLQLTQTQDIVVQAISDSFLTLYFSSMSNVTTPNATNTAAPAAYTGFDGMAHIFKMPKDLSIFCQDKIRQGRPCDLYVGVVSQEAADFTIEATISNSTADPLPLPTETEHTGMLNARQSDYFEGTLLMAGNDAIHVNLLSVFGDVDLYITLGNHPKGFGRDHYNYSSIQIGAGLDTISIYPDDKARRKECPCTLPPCECTIRITVYNYNTGFSMYDLLVQTNDTIVPISADGRQIPGAADRGSATFYRIPFSKYSAFDPVDLDIAVSAQQGELQLLASVDDGRAPPTLPKPGNATWATAPDSGTAVLRIAHDDPNRCHSKLNSWDCAYIVGVQSTSSVEAEFLISASTRQVSPSPAPGASPSPKPAPEADPLLTGQPRSGLVDSGNTVYFYYQWTTDSAATAKPPITLEWDVLSGPGVTIYVGNASDPSGKSPLVMPTHDKHCFSSLDLPFGTTSKTFTSDSQQCYRRPDQILTIAVQGYVTTPAERSEFSIVATVENVPVVLQPGVASDELVLPNNEMAYFLLHVPSPTKTDVIIEVTTVLGQVYAYVNNNDSLPTCTTTHSGASACSNYVWTNTLYPSEPITIRHSTPCAQPPATPSCSQQIIKDGKNKWTIGVHAFSGAAFSRFSVAYHLNGSHDELADGLPLWSETYLQHVCASRDEAGRCIGDPSTQRMRQAAYLTFAPPQSATPLDLLQVQLRKNCSAGRSCLSAANFSVALTACIPSLCSPEDRYPVPSWMGGQSLVTFNVTDDSDAFFVPSSLLACDSGDPDAQRCVYYLGVYPTSPLLSAGPEPFRIVMSSEKLLTYVGSVTGTTALPSMNVRTVNPALPEVFEVDVDGKANVYVYGTPCSPVEPVIYACARGYGGLKNRCPHGGTRPGPNNYVAKSSWDSSAGAAELSLAGVQDTSVFLAVFLNHTTPFRRRQLEEGSRASSSLRLADRSSAPQLAVGNIVPHIASQLLVYSGKATQLKGHPELPNVQVADGDSADLATVVVEWKPASLSFHGGQYVPAVGVTYSVFLIPLDALSPSTDYLNSSCGIDFAMSKDAVSSKSYWHETGAHSVTFDGVETSPQVYYVSIVARCDSSCMRGQPAQAIAYGTTSVDVTAPGPNPQPSKRETDDHNGPNGGAIAGGIIGALAAVGLITAAVWYARKRYRSHQPGTDAYFDTSLNYAQMED